MATYKKLSVILITGMVLFTVSLSGQQVPDTFKNPILPGFHPDPSPDEQQRIGSVQNLNVIADETSGLFNGPYIGMYATGNGLESKTTAEFDWFEYKGY